MVNSSPGSGPEASGAGPLPGQARPGVTGGAARGSADRSMWDVGAGNAETVLAEARKALFVMVGFLAILWIIQIANWADHYQLTF